MTLQNRVTPLGALVAVPARGALMGNRGGRIHDTATRTLTRRRWASRRWICCRLTFKDRHRTVWGESYTEVFFHDEAAALAAGHRPCYECRRHDAVAFADAIRRALDLDRPPGADWLDARLHPERLTPPADRPPAPDRMALPEGSVVAQGQQAFVVSGGRLYPWESFGWANRPLDRQRLSNAVLVTPPTAFAALDAGYRVDVRIGRSRDQLKD